MTKDARRRVGGKAALKVLSQMDKEEGNSPLQKIERRRKSVDAFNF